MAEEQIRSVIGVTYVGEDQVQRYLADLQRAGALTEATAGRLAGVWRAASAGTLNYAQAVRELAAGLNQGEAAIRRFLNQFNNVAAGNNAGNFVRAFNNDLAQLDRLSRQAAIGMDAMARSRQRLASVFATQFGARVQDQMAGPVAVAAANPRLALPAAVAQPSRDDRRVERIMGALERREVQQGIGIAGGNPFASQQAIAQFERLNPALRETESRVRALNAALAGITARVAGRPSFDDRRWTQEARARTVDYNRGALTQLASQYSRAGGGDYNDFLRQIAEAPTRGMSPQDRGLLYHGRVSAQHVRQNPDLMNALFGASTAADLTTGIGRGGAAAQMPGLTSVDRVMSDMQAEYDRAALRSIETRTRRLQQALVEQARAAGAMPLNRYALSTLQGLWRDQMTAMPGLALPQLETAEANRRRAALNPPLPQYGPPGTKFFASAEAGEAWAQHPSVFPQMAGMMRFSPDGLIESILTHPLMRRQGIATGMLQTARAQGIDVFHSSHRTDEGEAWARSLNEPLPHRFTDREIRNIYAAGGDIETEARELANTLRRANARLEAVLPSRALAPWRGHGTAYGDLDPRLAAGTIQGRIQAAEAWVQARRAERPMAIDYARGNAAFLQPGMGTSVDARTLLAQQPQVVPGTVVSRTDVPLYGGTQASNAPAQLAANLLRASGGDVDQVRTAMRGLGYSATQVRQALDGAAQAAVRETQAERQATQATQANTAAEQANTAAQRAQQQAFGPYRAGMRMPVPHDPATAGPIPRTFVAGAQGTYENLPAVYRPTGTGLQVYNAVEAQAQSARLADREAQRLAQAQSELRQRLTQYSGTTALNNRLAQAAAARHGTTPPPYVMPGAFAGYGMPAAPRQPLFYPTNIGGLPPGMGGGGYGSGGGGAYGGGGGGFIDDFRSGFRGRGEAPYAQQLGQTFKFATFYGAAYKILFAITQTFQQTLQEAIAFQESMVDLNIATGATSEAAREANRELAERLGAIATEAGFAPGEGVTAGARAIGLYGLTDAPRPEQELAARLSARTATMLAFGSGRPYEDIQGDLGAIAQGFGTGYAGQQQVADLDAYLSRRFGIKAGSTIQPVAETAAVANLAGFSLEESTAISANLQSRTGQSASTIGGLLTQIFTRSGEGSLVEVAQRYGIDQRQSLRDQMEQLGEVYRNADPTEQARIASTFGRGRSQNVAAVLLGDSAEIFEEAARAQTKAQGAAEEQFEERLNNIGGQLKQLQGQFMQFAKALGEAGLLAVVGAGIKTLGAFFDAVTPVLNLFAALPGPMNEVIIGLAALAAASKAGVVGAGANALINRAGMVTGGARGALATRMGLAGMATRTNLLTGQTLMVSRTGQMAAGPAIAGAAGTGARAISGAGTAMSRLGMVARAAGAGLIGLTGTVPLAIGGLLAIGQIKSAMDRFDEASNVVTDALGGFAAGLPVGGYTADDLRSQSAQYTQLAEQNRTADEGFSGRLTQAVTFGQANNEAENDAVWLDRRARYMERLANRLDEVAEDQFGEASPLFSAFDSEGISSGFETLAASGASATVQMQALRDALFEAGGAANRARQEFDPQLEARNLGASLITALTGGGRRGYRPLTTALTGGGDQGIDIQGMDLTGADVNEAVVSVTGKRIAETARGLRLTDQQMRKRLNRAFAELDITSADDLSKRAPQVADEVMGNMADRIGKQLGLQPEEIEAVRKQMRRNFIQAIRRQMQDRVDLLDPDRTFTGGEALDAITGLSTQTDTLMGELEEGDYSGRRQLAGRLMRDARSIINRAEPGEDISGAVQLYNRARRQFGETKIAELDNLRRAAQSDARGRRQVSQIGRRFMRQMVRVAVRQGNADQLARIIEDVGPLAVNVAREAIRDALQIAMAAARMQYVLANALEDDISTAIKLLNAPGTRSSPETKRLNRMLKDVDSSMPKQTKPGESEIIYGGDVPGLDVAPGDKAAEDRATAAQIAAARAASGVAADDTVGQARAALQSAQADLDAIDRKDDPVGYWNAVKAVNDARHEYATAQAEAAAAARAATIAPDDAVGQAAADIQAARDALANATPGSTAYSEALAQLTQAQFAYSQAQADVASAAAEAEAARDGGAIAAARAQIDAASRQMQIATHGTAAYYQALASYYQGQQALADAVRQHAENEWLLGQDITNPLVQARAAMRTAARKLAQDRRAGRGEDVIAQDELDMRRAQAEVEATKFSQRLQAVQTAEDLGRISHQRYLRYLENEKRRLEGIKDRTYQQQQQLNEIDQAMKAAHEQAQGQFNLGDIDTSGLVYQTRLAAAERRAARRDDRREQTVSIRIDGTDVAMVRQVLRETLGPNSTQTMSVTRRKV